MESKQGACSCNTVGAKANCLKHNRREQVPSYINPNLSHLNRTLYESDEIRQYKYLAPLVKKAQQEYQDKVGQKAQEKMEPFRESCAVVKAGITDEQFMSFARSMEQMTGWKCVGVWVHNDEGHTNSKWIEGNTDFSINYHAHFLWDCQDHTTGKIKRPIRDFYRRSQDLLAAATGMERGNPVELTGRRRRSADQQRIHACEERIAKLEAIATKKDAQIATQQSLLDEIAADIRMLSEDKSVKEAKKQAKLAEWHLKYENAKNAMLASGEWAAGLFGLTKKDKTIKDLQQQVQTLTSERDDAVKVKDQTVADSKAAYKKGFTAGKKNACDEIYARQRWDATTTIKEVHSVDTVCRHFADQAKELKEQKELTKAWCDIAKGKNTQQQGQAFHR